jgi:hypothetical protein
VDGYYPPSDPPLSGLAAARMSALLTYRSRNSFESRFGRNVPDPTKHPYPERAPPQTPEEENWVIHNDGHRLRSDRPSAVRTRRSSETPAPELHFAQTNGTSKKPQHHFSAQSYLRYQGSKFVQRFDPNCYISITRKLDTHDIARSRFPSIQDALASLPQPALVLGIESDGLFTFAEQQEIAEGLPNARLEKISSPEGHDGFLLEFNLVNRHILGFMKTVLPEIMDIDSAATDEADCKAVKSSLFGEAEVEVHPRGLELIVGYYFLVAWQFGYGTFIHGLLILRAVEMYLFPGIVVRDWFKSPYGSSSSAQCVHHVINRHSPSPAHFRDDAAVLQYLIKVAFEGRYLVQEGLQDIAGLWVDSLTDPFDSSATGETTNVRGSDPVNALSMNFSCATATVINCDVR